MIQIKVKRKINSTILNHKMGKTEQISVLELDIIKKGEIEAIQPAQVVTSLLGTKLEFVIKDDIDVPSYLRSGISFGEFTNLIFRILEVIKECHSYGIRVSNLEMRPEYMYYNYTNEKLKMIYWPLISLAEYADEKKLFEALPGYYSCKPEDEIFKNKYCKYFENRKKFDVYCFEKTIRLMQKQWKEQGTNEEEFLSGKVELFSDSNDKGKWNDIYDKTVALTHPSILRVSTNSRIEIMKTPFIIGRAQEQCDYVIEDNYYIGRKHAIFQQEGGQIFIIDNNSTNGIKIDGERIPAGEKVLLNSGNIIEIGREEFVYFAQAGYLCN